ncbi:MAG: LptF/LptG family permease [Candidatus Palauibacterales bacterium]|nr:LptF/LptG family permease [Candidatus Palauibacterales bacterium]MDP2482859.1 LptF/LptG family permease [Candidatus Palauibacterales bacterium]
MRILSRYVLKQLIAPFTFAVTALTLLMLLDQLAKQFHKLVGKGLGARVIFEVFFYSIPFILAVIIPMAVLVAVLYAFNRLAADNEIAAMKASGVSLARIAAPVVLAATLVGAGMVWFNDTVLPDANYRLASLRVSIGRKQPTFALQERRVNEVIERRLFLQAAHIDNATSQLENVTIWDERDPERSRTIYADSGSMAFNEAQTDLYLTLFDGKILETRESSPETLTEVWFGKNDIRISEVGNELNRDLSRYRSDRELPIDSMMAQVREAKVEAQRVEDVSRAMAMAATSRRLGGLAPEEAELAPADTAGPVAEAWKTGRRLEVPSSAYNSFRANAIQLQRHRETANRFEVEIWKKFTIPAACIVFVLIGVPVAVRFRRGGVGLVVGVSLAVFCLYYVALIGGEKLADRRLLSPALAMWSPNILFGLIGITGFFQARRAGG